MCLTGSKKPLHHSRYSDTPSTVLPTWLKPLDLALFFWKTYICRRLWRCTEAQAHHFRQKACQQFLLLCSSFTDRGNILDEILLTCKGGCFAFTVNASEAPIWFEAEISHHFLLHQGMPPEAHFHWLQGLTCCVHFQRRTERKVPKVKEKSLTSLDSMGHFTTILAQLHQS